MPRVGIRDHQRSGGVIFGPIPHLAFIARAGQESNLPAFLQKCTCDHTAHWLRGLDLNEGPAAYEAAELPGCSTTLYYWAGVLTLLGRHSTVQPANNKKVTQGSAPTLPAVLLSKHLHLLDMNRMYYGGALSAFAANADVWL